MFDVDATLMRSFLRVDARLIRSYLHADTTLMLSHLHADAKLIISYLQVVATLMRFYFHVGVTYADEICKAWRYKKKKKKTKPKGFKNNHMYMLNHTSTGSNPNFRYLKIQIIRNPIHLGKLE